MDSNAGNSASTKRCTKCRQLKQISEFYRSAAKRDGRQSWCVPCVRQSVAEYRATVLRHYGTSCACCGSTELLEIDHIGGGGAKHRTELFGRPNAGGEVFYRWLIKAGFPPGYQTLCRLCNRSKHDGERCRLAHSA